MEPLSKFYYYSLFAAWKSGGEKNKGNHYEIFNSNCVVCWTHFWFESITQSIENFIQAFKYSHTHRTYCNTHRHKMTYAFEGYAKACWLLQWPDNDRMEIPKWRMNYYYMEEMGSSREDVCLCKWLSQIWLLYTQTHTHTTHVQGRA